MKRLNSILAVIILISSVIFGHQIISISIYNQTHKYDYAEINNIKYGLLNVEEWKKQINIILETELNTLYSTKTTEYEFKKRIRVLIKTLIDKIDKHIRKNNSNSAGGWVRQSFINIFLSPDDIKKGIPKYTNAIIHEMKKTKTRNHIKIILNEQIEKYFELTFDTSEKPGIDYILHRTQSFSIDNAKARLFNTISVTNKLIFIETAILIILTLFLFSLSFFNTGVLTPSRYVYLVISLLILLTVGLLTPLIDLDIKISKFSFMLMGHTVAFRDQVIYFQSKSIIDIFIMLVKHNDTQIKLAGMLVALFIIILPILKITSSTCYYFNYRNARNNPVICFFIKKSGRWFIEATMIISTLMTYTIFNRIISGRFNHFNAVSRDLIVALKNDTYLQPGYYAYLAYAIFALFLTDYLSRDRHMTSSINNQIKPTT
ncbi:MAG: hypothetical protein CVV49_16775 [Spirochaetae bacterium HGW-Spirochaetae-5]|nr:MAG: hypothetical protein CVV49_16775 [Spirochaetae bacterium HGW-Spirochaetae-5]